MILFILPGRQVNYADLVVCKSRRWLFRGFPLDTTSYFYTFIVALRLVSGSTIELAEDILFITQLLHGMPPQRKLYLLCYE